MGLRDLILGSTNADWLALGLSELASERSACSGARCCFLAFWKREAPSTTVCTASVAPPISCSTSVIAFNPPAVKSSQPWAGHMSWLPNGDQWTI